MALKQIETLNNAIKRLETEQCAIFNQVRNLVACVNNPKNAYTSIANTTSYLNNCLPPQGNWYGNLKKLLMSR